MKDWLLAVTLPVSLSGLAMLKWSDSDLIGLAILLFGLLLTPVVFFIRVNSKSYKKLKKTVNFISQLEHCQSFCASNKLEWPFEKELIILKSRRKILEVAINHVKACEKGEELLLITNNFNLNEEMWKLLIEASKKITIRTLVNEEKVNPSWKVHYESLKKNSQIKNVDTDGIRLFLLRYKAGYICNSKSITDKGDPDKYLGLYSSDPTWRVTIESIFDRYWEKARPLI